jgi:RNA 3'-terminal phosphate cyclase-like protein
VKFRSYQSSEVIFTCGVKKQLLTLRNQLNQDCGKVKKVRGLAYGFRVSPQMLSRIITSAKGVFLPYINDVFITNDPIKNNKSKIPGYGIVLYAETTKNIYYAADGFIGRGEDNQGENELSAHGVTAQNLDKVQVGLKRSFELFPEDDAEDGQEQSKKKSKLAVETDKDKSKSSEGKKGGISSPEELGEVIAKQLLREIATQSRVDSVFQWLVLGFMALGPKDVTSVVFGPITPFTVQFLRDMRTFFGVTFKVEDFKEDTPANGDEEYDAAEEKRSRLHKLSCLGTGYINLNKTMV